MSSNKPTKHLLLTVGACCLAAFPPVAINFNLLAQPQRFIQVFINESFHNNYGVVLGESELKLAFGLLTSTHYIFGPVGVFLCQYLINRIGRRYVLFGIEGCFNVCSAIAYLSARYVGYAEVLYLSRALLGIDWGMHMVAMSTYVSEISPPKLRGRISSTIMLAGTSSTLLLFIFGLPELLNTQELWHFQVILVFPSLILQAVSLFLGVPESPKYLFINRSDEAGGLAIIRKLWGTSVSMKAVEKSFKREAEQSKKGLTLKDILKDPPLRATLLLATALAVSRLTCGGMLLNQYSYILYTEDLGLSARFANYTIAGVMLLMILLSLAGTWLIDKAGRRTLVLFGLFGNSILAVLYVITSVVYEQNPTYSWLLYCSIALVISMQGMFPLCLSMVTYFTVGEITPQSARPTTTSFATNMGIISRITYYFVFPSLQAAAGVYTLLILVSIPCTAIAIYLAIDLPETKSRPVDAVVDEMIRRKSTATILLQDLQIAQAHAAAQVVAK